MSERILDIIYNYLSEHSPAPQSEKLEEEIKAYEKLEEILTKEQFALFSDFLSLYSHAFCQESVFYFKLGFSKGIQFVEEIQQNIDN